MHLCFKEKPFLKKHGVLEQKQPFKKLEIPGGEGEHQNLPWNGNSKGTGGRRKNLPLEGGGGYGHLLELHIVKFLYAEGVFFKRRQRCIIFAVIPQPQIKHSGVHSERTGKIDRSCGRGGGGGFCWFLMFTRLTQLSVNTITGLLKLF